MSDEVRYRGKESGASIDPELSIVIPVLNEEDNVQPLCDEIRDALASVVRYEIIFVDDGSTDATAARIRPCMQEGNVRLLRHSARAGQSAAIRTGVRAARGPWIATLDGDGQNDPADLVRLWELSSRDPETGLWIGFRRIRRDGIIKRVSSRVANRVRRLILADDCHDSSCGVRMFRRQAFLDLPFFDHMHRFLPSLFKTYDHRVMPVEVNHRPRTRGDSKYGTWNRLWIGIIDLFGVMWLQSRSRIAAPDVEEEEREQ